MTCGLFNTVQGKGGRQWDTTRFSFIAFFGWMGPGYSCLVNDRISVCIYYYFSPQTSVDSVEELLKKHEEFESTSAAHDERIRVLSEQANKLIQSGHYDATG